MFNRRKRSLSAHRWQTSIEAKAEIETQRREDYELALEQARDMIAMGIGARVLPRYVPPLSGRHERRQRYNTSQ